MNSPDPDFSQAAADFRKGGWIVSLLGLAGGLTAMLLSDKHYPKLVWLKRTIAGGLTGVIMYFSLHGVEMNGITKSVLMCTAGAFSLEWYQWMAAKIKGDTNNEKRKQRRR